MAEELLVLQETVHSLHVHSNGGCVLLTISLQVIEVLAGFGLNPFAKTKIPVGDILFNLIGKCFCDIFHAASKSKLARGLMRPIGLRANRWHLQGISSIV